MEINNLKDIGNFIYKYRFILILALVIGFSYGFLKQKSNLCWENRLKMKKLQML